VLQTAAETPEINALCALLAEQATELEVFTAPFADGAAATKFAQGPAQVFGGLEAIVNIVGISRRELRGLASFEDVEDLVADKLLAPALITHVAANRMRLTWTKGLVLNVVKMDEPETAGEAALAGIVRTALAALTRKEAERWADQEIRVNAIGPRASLLGPSGGCLTSESDVASLALYLASRKGRELSGHVFDAAGVARRGC
jgi:3-oxoacyl-[acyl-carrier protein] reductase